MPTGDFPPAARCCCNQHRAETFGGANDAAHSYVSAREAAEYFVDRHVRFSEPIVGAVTFSDPGMIEHVRRAVDDYVAGLGEVEDDAATVVELLQRGDSWHISIRRGAMHFENAEQGLPAALEAVGRVLGSPEKPSGILPGLPPEAWYEPQVGQGVGSCAEVPTDCPLDAAVHAQGWAQINGMRDAIDRKLMADLFAPQRAELLASLPPVQITDPEALSKLTPARVRAYLKGKGWRPGAFEFEWRTGSCLAHMGDSTDALRICAYVEARSAAAVYLDILQTEPEAPSDPRRGYAP